MITAIRKLSGLSLSIKILLSLVLGLLCGLFFGEAMSRVEIIAEIFLKLLYMAVLPYILVSVVYSVARIELATLRKIALYGGFALALLWSISLLIIMQSSVAFPAWPSARFFSLTLLQSTPSIDFLSQFIPNNPFQSLSEATVPAVVVFSIILGLGLSLTDTKNRLLEPLNTLENALGQITFIVMKFAPIGIFCLAAAAAGTIRSDELEGIYIYLVLSSVIGLYLCLWVIPYLTSIITPYRYRQIMPVISDALITAFATGNFFVVLPILNERIKTLLVKNTYNPQKQEAIVDVVLPISYSLPTAGKLLTLIFVLFAGWFSSEPLAPSDLPALAISGLGNLFSSPMLVLPTLLEQFNIPGDIFKLYIATEQIAVARLNAILSVSFCASLTLIVAAGVNKKLTLRWKAALRFIVISWLLALFIQWLLLQAFSAIGHHYKGYEDFVNRQLMRPAASPSLVLTQPNEEQINPLGSSRNTLQRIQERGFIRMGYYRDWLPYAFHNQQGELVGLDIELAQQLARDLDVGIEFVRIYRKDAETLLTNGYLDLTTGVALSPSNMIRFTLSPSYTQETMAMVVSKERRHEFRTWEKIRQQQDLIIGLPESFISAKQLKELLPNATVWDIASPRLLFKKDKYDFDTMMYGAAGSSSWTLINPDYIVVVPKPDIISVPLSLPLARGDQQFELFMRSWLQLKHEDGTIQAFYDYWLKGENNLDKPRRWSIYHDLIQSQKTEGASTPLDSEIN